MRGLYGHKEHDVVLSQGIPLLPDVDAVEVREVERHLGEHLHAEERRQAEDKNITDHKVRRPLRTSTAAVLQ